MLFICSIAIMCWNKAQFGFASFTTLQMASVSLSVIRMILLPWLLCRRVDADGMLRSKKVLIKSSTLPRWAEKVTLCVVKQCIVLLHHHMKCIQ